MEMFTIENLTTEHIIQLRESLYGKPTVTAAIIALSKVGDVVNGLRITQAEIDAAREHCVEILNRRLARASRSEGR